MKKTPHSLAYPDPLTSSSFARIISLIEQHNWPDTAFLSEGISVQRMLEILEEKPELKALIEVAEAKAETKATLQLNTLADNGHAGAIMWRQERRYSTWTKAAPQSDKEEPSMPTVILPPNGRETNGKP